MDCSIFQSEDWERFKLKTGYNKSHRIEGILILQKTLPFGRSMLYAPMVSENQFSVISSQLSKFEEQIKQISDQNNSIFYRLELNIPRIENWKMKTGNWTKSFEEMQPEHNWLIDLSKTEEELLADMKQKGRYNIRVAEKNNLRVTSSNQVGAELDAFYSEYSETGKRHKVTFRSKEYFSSLLEILGQKDYARVYTIWHENTPLASNLMIFSGKAALYLYGGSSEQYRNLMAPYLLHWHIMKECKEKGLSEYNFLGVAPDDDPNHKLAGITRFKKQFGGFQVDVLGCYDLVCKPLEYKLFKQAEKIRR